jgi:hypothetical protein
MSNLFRNIIEIGFGLLFLIGAIFSCLYTWRHGNEFYGSIADTAFLIPSKQIVRKVVIPRARLFTGMLIAGAVFCFSAALVSWSGCMRRLSSSKPQAATWLEGC